MFSAQARETGFSECEDLPEATTLGLRGRYFLNRQSLPRLYYRADELRSNSYRGRKKRSEGIVAHRGLFVFSGGRPIRKSPLFD